MIKRRFVVFTLLTLLAIGIAGNADAQRSKRKESRQARKEQKMKEKVARKKQKLERKARRHADWNEPAPQYKKKPVAVKKKRTVNYPPTVFKPRYRVDVLMPMYLDELVKGKSVTFKDRFPEKALPGMSFYEGVMIAADSLKKAGYKIDIYIHDVASVNEASPVLVSKGKLDSADLIIGAVPTTDIPVLADHAKKKQINFISALTASDGGVKGNEFFTLIQPSLKTHCEWIAADIEKKFPGQRVTLLYRNQQTAEENAYGYFSKVVGGKANYKTVSVNTIPDKEALATVVFDTAKPNIVIVSVLDNAYAETVLKMLARNFPSTHFEVYGMPSWTGISNLHKAAAYPNQAINISTAFHFDPASKTGQYINTKYKNEYGGKPSEMTYRGFEAMFWYAGLLKEYGTIFNENYSDNKNAPFTRFEVKPQWDNAGNILFHENIHVSLSTYEGGVHKAE